MFRNILIDAVNAHGFQRVEASEGVDFFRYKKDGAERYLILKALGELCTIDELHGEVLGLLPSSLKIEPSFNKNCDLVLVHRIKTLSEFKRIESAALAFEEDPYHFKKYFLYYAEAEEKLISGKTYSDFLATIFKMDEFSDYKKNPLNPSLYGLAARTLIKLPFLEVPKSQKTLQSLSDIVLSAVSEKNLEKTFGLILSQTQQADIDVLVKELVREELENIKTANPGV